MTEADVRRIFKVDGEGYMRVGESSYTTVDFFLNVAGFKNAPANPTKEDLHAIDGGVKGYADFIETGVYN